MKFLICYDFLYSQGFRKTVFKENQEMEVDASSVNGAKKYITNHINGLYFRRNPAIKILSVTEIVN